MSPSSALDRVLAMLTDDRAAVPKFACELLARAPEDYLTARPSESIAGGVRSMFEWLESSTPGEFSVRVVRADWLTGNDADRHWALQITGPDQPFLVDSAREIVRVRDHSPTVLLHPILGIERNGTEGISDVHGPIGVGDHQSFIHLEVPGTLSDDDAKEIADEAREVFTDARAVANDFPALTETIRRLVVTIGDRGRDTNAPDLLEAAEFLDWLQSANFVFLGSCSYSRRPDGERNSTSPETLGVLRKIAPERIGGGDFTAQEGSRAVHVAKSEIESRVLRRARMDVIRVVDEGEMTETIFVGLFTARALGELPSRIPLLRRKLERLMTTSGVVVGSHDHKELFSVFCSLPKSHLFLHDAATLRELIFDLIDARDRELIRVHYDADRVASTLAVMVLIPKERFNPQVRQSVQYLLAREFDASTIEYQLALTDEPLARLHFYFSIAPGDSPYPSVQELEAKIARVTRTWPERLDEAIRARAEPAHATFLAERFSHAFPPSYQARETPEVAARDALLCADSVRDREPVVQVDAPRTGDVDSASLIRIVRPGREYHLSRLMPTLSNLGLHVFDEVTYRVRGPHRVDAFIHLFRAVGPRRGKISKSRYDALEEAILATLQGLCTDDRLAGLVLLSNASWRQVTILRAYAAYLLQIEPGLQRHSVFDGLLRYPKVAESLLELFESRFDPSLSEAAREERQKTVAAELHERMAAVRGIQEDRVLRSLENLVFATMRTNYFQRDELGDPRPALALKIHCAEVTHMPLPRPEREIFVSGPGVEGVHLRSGKVARGGIRWSARTDDYRTEVLGLMKAQRTKNALIVPVGAKGGFVLTSLSEEEDVHAAVEREYRNFISSLLDVADNSVDSVIHRPENTVIHDDDDPYLVVAADRGTAQLSDVANEIAEGRGFWLRDAFASGGSTGYSHKEVGITARGAWECVSRHFALSGKDIQLEEFRVVGIGDMSGDVFGNGMLLSPKIQLVAAFNHEHIFVDPTPDAETSFEERLRLFQLPRSKWSDYDTKKISPGGGVFDRSSKRIDLSEEIREVLGIDETSLNGTELIRKLLALDVDLLWNGGIGTYVKSSTETHADVGDASNDDVRIDATELRAGVVGEGGNLGMTMLARIEYDRLGGLVNTDFIDNSGGVDLSDREVNLKILLDVAQKRGECSPDERNSVLRGVEDDVALRVLADNRSQSDALSSEQTRGSAQLPHLLELVRELEASELLDREVESIPSDAEFEALADTSMNLTRPQLSVLVAYAKIDAFERVLRTDLPKRDELNRFVTSYFPAEFSSNYAASIRNHPLRDEIIVTALVGQCVDRMGVTFLSRVSREEKRSLADALFAYVQASDAADSDSFYASLDEWLNSADGEADEKLSVRNDFAAAIESTTRWFLRRSPGAVTSPEGDVRSQVTSCTDELERVQRLAAALEVEAISETSEHSPSDVSLALNAVDSKLRLPDLFRECARIRRQSLSDWQMLAALERGLWDLRRDVALRVLGSSPGTNNASVSAELDRLVQPDARWAEYIHSVDERASREPLLPSGFYVFVESLRRILE
ncbi:MAG: NAD-glutamate dehydrogenase domain-containing protein [Planctomycetota bacterium]